MKKSTKAALLSALVFPGVGQFWLKKHLSATLFFISFVIGLYFLIQHINQKVQYLLTQLQQGEIALTVEAITQALTNAPMTLSTSEVNWLSYSLLVIWLIATVHAYYCGKAVEPKPKT